MLRIERMLRIVTVCGLSDSARCRSLNIFVKKQQPPQNTSCTLRVRLLLLFFKNKNEA